MGRKPLQWKDTKLIYVFLDMNDFEGSPTEFIVPVADVAKQAIDAGFEEHPDWRIFYFKISKDDSEKYKENWSLIVDTE